MLDTPAELLDMEGCLNARFDFGRGDLLGLGELMGGLRQLSIGGSNLNSLRELGRGLQMVTCLGVSRCRLRDVEGLQAFPKLTLLFASHNSISSLSGTIMHPSLKHLDL
jgi:hypothetical protein